MSGLSSSDGLVHGGASAAAVIPGAEPWSGGEGDTGVLLLHGFTGNPVSLRPVAERLAASGLSVELPRLPGHGTDWRDCAQTGWRDWAREAVAAFEALRRRSRRQVVFGLSMGGALALHLAAQRGDDIAGLVLVNPWVRTRDWRAPIARVLQFALPTVPGVSNDIARPGADEKAYERVPVPAVISVMELQRRVQACLDRVTQPLLVLTSRVDHVVDPRDSAIVLGAVASTDVEQVWLERSYHVATLDHDADLICERTIAFARRLAGSGPEADRGRSQEQAPQRGRGTT